MDFITRFCANLAEWPLAVMAIVCLAACSPGDTDFGFSIERVESVETTDGYSVTVVQKMTLSEEAKNALRHGVPLSLQTEIALGTLGSRSSISSSKRGFQIRYLPLSNLYQLSSANPSSVITRPRLRHVLAELSTIIFKLPTVSPAGEQLEIRVRSSLDKTQLPSPMRLPTLFSNQWTHDTGWKSWPINRLLDNLKAVPL